MERRVGRHRDWTSQELSLLIKLFNSGMTLTYICERLGRSRRTVKYQLLKNGIDPEDRKETKPNIKASASEQALARELVMKAWV